ncbi:MAG: FHA domain-containing protein [Acinetobacter sp.]|nr:MAG: FHA domain-containing protein [Acinetobacter sp.]
MTWKLQGISVEVAGQEIIIECDMLVGRHDDADILLQSAQVSRRHAVLICKNEQIVVQDLESTNGTFLNDERISQEAELQDQDVLQFAGVKFTVLAPVRSQTDLDGMPSIAERAAATAINANGMPQQVDIPKPAPIPANAPAQTAVSPTNGKKKSRKERRLERQKNIRVGLVSLMVLIILALMAWMWF